MKDIAKLPKKITEMGKNPMEVISFTIDKINELIDAFNFSVSKNTLSSFDGQIIQVSFSAGEDKVIPHKLGKKPLYRIILNQEGNGVLTDTPSGWNNFQIQLKNNGAVSVTATVLLLRE